jgi:GDPmannose 4,6-dehydratase
VRQDPKFLAPADGGLLIVEASKARDQLGWQPEVGFAELNRFVLPHDFN